MSQQNNILTIGMIKSGNKLSYTNSSQKLLYEEFLETLKENQKVEIFIEAVTNTGTNNQ